MFSIGIQRKAYTSEYKDETVNLVINTGHVVFHSSRVTQYASEQITKFAAGIGITRSMGCTGV